MVTRRETIRPRSTAARAALGGVLALAVVSPAAAQPAATHPSGAATPPPPASTATTPVKPAAPPARGRAPSPGTAAPAPSFDAWLPAQRDTLGRACNRRTLVEGTRIVVACGAAGVWIVEPQPDGGFALLDTQDLGGDVIGLFERDGMVWAEIARLEARPVRIDAVSTRAFPTEPSTPPTSVERPVPSRPVAPPPLAVVPRPVRTPEGKVTEASLGEVVIDLGSNQGLKHGDRIELSETTSEDVGGELASRRSVTAVGVVTAVAPGFARVQLGMNERAPVGATARFVTRDRTQSRVSPPRLSSLWEVAFRVRPFVTLDGLGGGALTQASVGYRFDAPVHVAAEAYPFGYANGKGTPAVVPVATFVSASYDHEVFEIGLGLGLETVNDTTFQVDAGTGTLIAQRLRLGARDGLNLDLRNDVVLFHSSFEFSGLVGSALIPVGSSSWLAFEGGGGTAGYGYGEVGVRSLLRGNGDRGSVYFTVSVGGVTMFEDRTRTCGGPGFTFECGDTVTYGGPMLGAGGEWRL